MRIKGIALSVALLLACLASVSAANWGSTRNTLFQFAPFEALMSGNFDGQTACSTLLQQGDFGIGTFDRLDGEMIILDGKIYQVKSDKKVYRLSPAALTPYGFVCRFSEQSRSRLPDGTTLDGLQRSLDQTAPNPNLFYAFRISGLFKSVKVRTVPAQSKPYPTLLEATKMQITMEWDLLKGTLIGFRCPSYIQGINYPGYHFHFLSSDHQKGGHLLACELNDGLIKIQALPQFKLVLPEGLHAYQNLKPGTDRLQEMRQIVGDKK